MFSKTCEYAIKIMVYLAAREKGSLWAGVEEIAGAIDSPRAFTAKILQQLVRSGLLDSLRGRSGGFALPSGKSISLADIVAAMDGDALMTGCVLGFHTCTEAHPCPVHHKFKSIREHLKTTLLTTSLDELSELMGRKEAFLMSL